MSENTADTLLYGIGAVAKLTGLTDHTIRVWERRYAAVVTTRAPNGRRQYTESDVEKLGLLKSLTDRGRPGHTVCGILRLDRAPIRSRSHCLATSCLAS
jgi:DNA-binding transcriptional MerR regulator